MTGNLVTVGSDLYMVVVNDNKAMIADATTGVIKFNGIVSQCITKIDYILGGADGVFLFGRALNIAASINAVAKISSVTWRHVYTLGR